jgi:hypothetical protein
VKKKRLKLRLEGGNLGKLCFWKLGKISKSLRSLKRSDFPKQQWNYLYSFHKPPKSHEVYPVHPFTLSSSSKAPLLRSRFDQTFSSKGSDPSLRFSKHQDLINGDDDTSGIQSENTLETACTQVLLVALTRVTQKPKVISPQPLPRDVGFNYGMTSDQTSWRGNLFI